MAEDFKIGEAYIEFSTRGDVKGETRAQAQAAERLKESARGLHSLQRQGDAERRRADEERSRRDERSRQNDADRARSALEAARRNERIYFQEKDRKEEDRRLDRLAAQERTARQAHLMNQSQAASTVLGAVGHAAGGLPFVGAAANLGQAMVAARQHAMSNAIEEGASKSAAAAAGRAAMMKAGAVGLAAGGIAYGIEGAKKASPQAAEQLQYQMDRLQAIIGRDFVPAVQAAAKVLERVGDFFGGKGAQLNMPQFSDFAQMRDRLQVAALAGMPADQVAGKGAGGGESFVQRVRNSIGAGWAIPGYAVWRMAGGRSIQSLFE